MENLSRNEQITCSGGNIILFATTLLKNAIYIMSRLFGRKR